MPLFTFVLIFIYFAGQTPRKLFFTPHTARNEEPCTVASRYLQPQKLWYREGNQREISSPEPSAQLLLTNVHDEELPLPIDITEQLNKLEVLTLQESALDEELAQHPVALRNKATPCNYDGYWREDTVALPCHSSYRLHRE